ncbi:putative reverse transcriptase domain-containing protein [Tanacetum coccineum]
MSDLEHSTFTYTSISSDYEEPSDVGSPEVVVYGYDALPMHPPSTDYVPGPEHPPSPVYVPYVPEPAYPEFMPLEDDVFPNEEQPLPAAVSPTVDSPGYITKSDPKEDPKEEEDDEDLEEDLDDYLDDKDDKEEEESFGDDADDKEEDEGEDEEEEEEHLAPADSVPPPQTGTRRARMTVRPQPPIAASIGALIVVVGATLPLPSPPPSPLPISPTHPLETLPPGTPPSGTPPLLPISLPTSSPPLLLPSTDCRADVLEVMLPPQKWLCITPGPRYEIEESSSAPTARPTRGFRADYGFVGTLDAEIRRDMDKEIGYEITKFWEDPDEIAEEILATDVAALGKRITDFVTTDRQDTDEIYRRLDYAQDDRLVMSGQLNLLRRDKCSYGRTARLMEGEARAAQEAWAQSMDASDMTRYEVRALRTTILAQQIKIKDLQAADRRRQTQLIKALTLLRTLQTHMVALQRVADVLVERDAAKSRNGKDSHDSGTCVRRTERAARECTYPDFMKCQPLNFKGTKGVVELTQWFKRMETVFRISSCTDCWSRCCICNDLDKPEKDDDQQVLPKGEIKKLEVVMMFPEESDNIEKYVGGFPDMIHGSVMASKPKTMQDAIEFATEMMDKKISTFTERTGEKKPYGRSKPMCSKCNYHHDGPCSPKCHKCNRVGHLARDCRSPANANTANNQRGTRQVRKLLALSAEPKDISKGSV